MPALVEPGSENKRPRRSSITQHLQRILHIDKQGDQRKTSSHEEALSDADTATSIPQQHTHIVGLGANNSDPLDFVDITSNAHSRHSYSSLSSKLTGLNTLGSRHSSSQSFSQEVQSPLTVATGDGPSDKPGIYVSSTWSHNVVQKQDRRATRRLEAERMELEKRLLKLEEAERTGDPSLLRRESRRLTKKQPLGSSSRSSSASGDESRPPSRLSSIFSSSRRRSRSRSSSIDGDDNNARLKRHDNGSGETSSSDNPNTHSTLSMTLPERLGAAISKGLATKKNSLLASTEQSIKSQKLSEPDKASVSFQEPSTGKLRADGDDLAPSSQPDPVSGDSFRKGEDSESKEPTAKGTPSQEVDLDRALFAASLKSGNRSVPSSLSGSSERTITQAIHHSKQNASGPSKAHTTPVLDQSASRSGLIRQDGLPKNTLLRSSTDGVVLKHQKKFKSSPLAGSSIINNDLDSLSGPEMATASPESPDLDSAKRKPLSRSSKLAAGTNMDTKNSPNVRQSSSSRSPNRMRTFSMTFNSISRPPTSSSSRSSQTSSNIASSSKFNQTSPSILLTKPRFYNSSGKPLGNSGGSQSTSKMGIEPIPFQEHESPLLPPKSPKRTSQVMSQQLDLKSDQRQRPRSGLSTTSRSQESGSDGYDTADETISNKPFGPPNKGAIENTRTASENWALASGKSSSTLVVSSAPRSQSKIPLKQKRKAKREQGVAKLFVICCRCKFWHDMPSEVYARLAITDPFSAASDEELSNSWDQNSLASRLAAQKPGLYTVSPSPSKPQAKSDPRQKNALRTRMTTDVSFFPVECCWCNHNMSKQCCQGWTTVVHMQQRHH